MGVMTCPHCEESIDSLTRTGDRKYSCGQCNMVIKYDEVQPNLDEMEVVDKREPDEPEPDQGEDEQPQEEPQDINTGSASVTEREKIYQRGVEGLKEIKKERLKGWLANTDGVGGQTETRILMVFDRNESVHKNPHVLYNLLDDEIGGSASYINTIVDDVFAPEDEYSDLLQSQGYTPWFNRGQSANMQSSNIMANQGGGGGGRNGGGPMNATGNNRFNPNQGNQGQQNQQNNQNQGNQGGGQDDSLSRQEAEMMMQQAVANADNQNQRNALMSGLSDATDQALQEMATNVGGLAGAAQKIIEEALVSYARDNPEWVIENMDILQKVMGATEGQSGSGGGGNEAPEENQKVDNALENITNQNSENEQNQANSGTNNDRSSNDSDTDYDIPEDYKEESDFNPSVGERATGMTAGPNDGQQPSEPQQDDSRQSQPQPEPDTQQSESQPEADEEDASFDDLFGDMSE